VDASDGKQQQKIRQCDDNNKDLIDLSSEIDVVDLTAWQCRYTDCHDMNSSACTYCKCCGRQTAQDNLKLSEAMTFVLSSLA